MSNTVLGIHQGDFIYYYNLSDGDIDRDWLFRGGTPTGGTGYYPVIQYNNVNLAGNDTSLTVTGYGGIQRTEYKSGIIVVYPELFSVAMSITPSNTGMGSSVVYLSTGGTGSGVASYSWDIPGLGIATGATLSSVSYTAEDWLTLTGTYSGLPNSSFTLTAILSSISNVGSNGSVNSNITYRKIGPVESVNYWNQGGTGIYATSGQYYDTNIYPYTTSSVGMGGNNILLQIDQQSYYPLSWDNAHFHSTDEVAYLYSNSFDAGPNVIKFRMILNGSLLDSLGVSYPASPEISTGNYIKTGYVHSFLDDSIYLTDYFTTSGGGQITTLSQSIGTGNRDWSNAAITSYLMNEYYVSGSSKYIENGGYLTSSFFYNKAPKYDLASVVAYNLGIEGYNFGGTSGVPPANFHGVSILSSYGTDNLYGWAGTIDIDIDLYNSNGDLIDSDTVIFSSGGDSGNSYDGMLILSQDTTYNGIYGIKSIMNSRFAVTGWDSCLIVEEAEYFSPYQNGGNSMAKRYDSNNFHGLRISIKEPYLYSDYIHSVDINWGAGYASFLSSVNGQIPTSHYNALASRFSSPLSSKSSKQSWTGLPNPIYPPRAESYSDYFKGWKYGGSL